MTEEKDVIVETTDDEAALISSIELEDKTFVDDITVQAETESEHHINREEEEIMVSDVATVETVATSENLQTTNVAQKTKFIWSEKLKQSFGKAFSFVKTQISAIDFASIKEKVLTAKTYGIVLLSLKILILALCVLQIAIWGIGLKDTYMSYWEAITSINIAEIIVIACILIFLIILIFNIVFAIISLIKKHDMNYGVISTLIAFYIIELFLKNILGENDILLATFDLGALFWVMISFVFILAVVRSIQNDFKKRIIPMVFCIIAAVLVFIVFSQNIGNFLSISSASNEFGIHDINLFAYIKVIVAHFEEDGVSSSGNEAIFLLISESTAGEWSINWEFIVIPLETVLLFFVNILPYMLLTLLGYLLLVLLESDYKQFYNLRACQKVSKIMLAMSIMELLFTIILTILINVTNEPNPASISYGNIVLTIVLIALMIVITMIPWEIYNIKYRHYKSKFENMIGEE